METQLSLSDIEVIALINILKRNKNDLLWDFEIEVVNEILRQLPERTKEEKPHLAHFL